MLFRKLRSRLDRLEREAGQARADHEWMRHVLAAFQVACSAAGVDLASAAADAVPGVPPALIAAARTPRPGGEPVVLDAGGMRAVAVIGPGGNPEAWMPAIFSAARFPAARQVTSVERSAFPVGLLAVAVVPRDGGLTLKVARDLGRHETRMAVSAAIRAARRTGWQDYRAGAISAAAVIIGLGLKAAPVKYAASAGLAAAGAVAATMLVLPAANMPYIVHGTTPGPAASAPRQQPPVTVRTTAPARSGGALAASSPTPMPQPPPPPASASPSPAASPGQLLPGPAGTLACVKLGSINVCL